MMLQRGALTLQCVSAAWGLDSTIPFFFFGSRHPDTVPLGIYGPVARWRLEKNAWQFFFFGSLANVPPVVCKRKKNKK